MPYQSRGPHQTGIYRREACENLLSASRRSLHVGAEALFGSVRRLSDLRGGWTAEVFAEGWNRGADCPERLHGPQGRQRPNARALDALSADAPAALSSNITASRSPSRKSSAFRPPP